MDERSQEERQRELEELAAELTLDPDSRVFARLAEAYRRAGLAADACRVAEHGLARHPDHLPGRMALGLAQLDLGRFEDARRVLTGVLDAIAADREEPPAAAVRSEPPDAAVETERAVGSPASPDGPSLEEIESAFAEAEARTDEMRDAVTVAHEAMRAENLDEPEVGSAERERAAPEPLGLDGAPFDETPFDEAPLEALGVSEAEVPPPDVDAGGEELELLAAEPEPLELDPEPEETCDPADGFSPSDHPAFATATMAGLLERQGERESAEAIRARLEGGEPPWLDAAEVPVDVAPAPPTDRRARVLATLEVWLRNIRREVR